MAAAQTTLDSSSFRSIDPQDMLGAILGLPEQVEDAKRIALGVSFESLTDKKFSALVIAGMGGSAIGGDFLRALYEPTLRVPVTVIRDYQLPGYVDENTLVFAASNSGKTEETLACYEQAKRAKCSLVAFTTGGSLKEDALADGNVAVTFPGGLQPRAALGYSFVPLIVASARLGLLPEVLLDELDEASAVLRSVRNECNAEVPEADNLAKQLAQSFHGKIPVVYGSQVERGVVAYRWKTQINENAKAYAVSNVFPELNHNETVGWSGTHGQGDPERELVVTILRDDREPAQIAKRVDLTKQIISRQKVPIRDVWARGESALSRMLSLVYVGDFASYYLAIAYGEDPTPVRVIDWLKAELAK